MWVLHGVDARTTFTIITISFAAAVKLIEDFRRAGSTPMTLTIDRVMDVDTERPDQESKPDRD